MDSMIHDPSNYPLKVWPKDSIRLRNSREYFGALINMSSTYPVTVGKVKVKSSEHLYQALRFNDEDHAELQSEVLATTNPFIAKSVAYEHITRTRDDWDKVKIQIMDFVLIAKLLSNWNTMGSLLTATGSKPIVEWSNKDVFWGARPTDPTNPEETLTGCNVLGCLLMKLRDIYLNRNKGDYRTNYMQITNVPEFFLLGKDISRVNWEVENKND